jgi:hypothetical protein
MSGMRDALVGRGVRRDRRCVADLDLTKSRQKFDRHGTLVTIGPYRWIRRPFYSSLVLGRCRQRTYCSKLVSLCHGRPGVHAPRNPVRKRRRELDFEVWRSVQNLYAANRSIFAPH